MTKELDGKQLLADVKKKVKQEKDGNMKKVHFDKKILGTIGVMLGIIALLALGTWAGWQIRGWFNENVKSEAKALSAITSKE